MDSIPHPAAVENFEPQKGTPDFPVVENELPARLGCNLTELVRLRQENFTRDVDFIRHKRRICLSHAAELRLLVFLSLADPQDLKNGAPLPAGPPMGPPTAKPVVILKTTGHKTMNPHIILAAAPSAPNALLRVRVKSKENFRPFMQVKVTHVNGDLYELVGNCPRFPGKY